VPVPADNPITDAKIALGTTLFYDPILSSDRKVACATCHSEQWGMGDGLPVSVGVDGKGATGPGRTGPNQTTRNAPTLWNVAFRKELFLDGRSPSLEDQALQPLRQPKEMNRPPEDSVLALREIPAYVGLFQAAFPGESDPISPENIAKAIAALERTVVSHRSPYDHYVAGDAGSLSELEQTGMQVFASSGCASCHAPPLFENEKYVKRFESSDDGRFAISHDEADRGAFRVPTLRNLRETGPYFHDGSVDAIEDAISKEVDVQVAQGLSEPLSADDMAALVKFLKSSLMDRSEEPFRPQSVPSGLEIPPDGFRIPR
jgi:cytochrome c peroxidase